MKNHELEYGPTILCYFYCKLYSYIMHLAYDGCRTRHNNHILSWKHLENYFTPSSSMKIHFNAIKVIVQGCLTIIIKSI